ncbi:MAG: MmcQ/YjbR family DNA-binding protein [Phycisphaerae bacterium]
MAKQTAPSEKQRTARLARMTDLCESLPGAAHEPAGLGHIRFRVAKKVFAWFLNNHHGDGIYSICCKSTLAKQSELVRRHPEVVYVPKYVGKQGWVAARIDLKDVAWELVNTLFVEAYRLQAPKRLLAELDG